MPEIYLDNAATTKVSPGSAAAAMEAMTGTWGNPSSVHHHGMQAELLLKRSKSTVAGELRVLPDEVFFTSGGTEANNTALLAAAHAMKSRGRRIITSLAEHSSVLDSAKRLEDEGFDVVYLQPDSGGAISAQAVESALTDDTILVSLMLVNNETGAINPVRDAAALLKRRRSQAVLHCDAVGAFGKLKVRPTELGCQLLSLSGHKLHAPKGIGALYIEKKLLGSLKRRSLHIGGAQQQGMRPGTEPMPLIAALAQAVAELPPTEHRLDVSAELRQRLIDRLADERFASAAPIRILSPDDGIASTVSISTGCIKSQTMLNYLSSRGIYVSAGSACSKGRKSHVLEALPLGADKERIIDTAIRISFCEQSTADEVDAFCNALYEGVTTLVRR